MLQNAEKKTQNIVETKKLWVNEGFCMASEFSHFAIVVILFK